MDLRPTAHSVTPHPDPHPQGGRGHGGGPTDPTIASARGARELPPPSRGRVGVGGTPRTSVNEETH
jgi:hypothetical protein